MAAKVVIFVAFLALASAGMVRRDAPAPNAGAAELNQHWDSMLKGLSELSKTLQGAAADATGKAKEALETAQRNIEDLRKAHPEVEQQAHDLGTKVQTVVNTVAQNAQNLAKEVQETASPAVKKAFDDFVKKAEEAHKQILGAPKQ